MKFVPRVALLREQLLGSGVERSRRRAIVQPIEMIGCGENGWCVCGLKCSGETLKTDWTSLGRDSTMPPKGVPRPSYQNRYNQGDGECRTRLDTNLHAESRSAEVSD